MSIDKQEYEAYLVCLLLKAFDIILGMEWMAKHKISIDYWERKLSLKDLEEWWYSMASLSTNMDKRL